MCFDILVSSLNLWDLNLHMQELRFPATWSPRTLHRIGLPTVISIFQDYFNAKVRTKGSPFSISKTLHIGSEIFGGKLPLAICLIVSKGRDFLPSLREMVVVMKSKPALRLVSHCRRWWRSPMMMDLKTWCIWFFLERPISAVYPEVFDWCRLQTVWRKLQSVTLS